MKIAVLQPKYLDAVWYYRMLPWLMLGRQTNTFVQPVSAESPFAFQSIIGSYDFLIVSRAQSKKHAMAVEYAKRYGVKVVFDYDDLIWEIPDDNLSAHSNDDADFQFRSVELIGMADAIIVSTVPLQREIKERFRKDSVLIRNACNDLIQEIRFEDRPFSPMAKIAHRGSNTHKDDLLSAREAFKEYDNILFKFFGYRPTELLQRNGGLLPYIDHTPWHPDPEVSFEIVRQWQADYMIFPLLNTTFRQCKSTIAWVEATLNNSVCIAPRYMEEFSAVPCLHYDTVDELTEHLEAINSGVRHMDILYDARNALIDNYLLSNVNQQRVDLLNIMAVGAVEEAREGGQAL